MGDEPELTKLERLGATDIDGNALIGELIWTSPARHGSPRIRCSIGTNGHLWSSTAWVDAPGLPFFSTDDTCRPSRAEAIDAAEALAARIATDDARSAA